MFLGISYTQFQSFTGLTNSQIITLLAMVITVVSATTLYNVGLKGYFQNQHKRNIPQVLSSVTRSYQLYLEQRKNLLKSVEELPSFQAYLASLDQGEPDLNQLARHTELDMLALAKTDPKTMYLRFIGTDAMERLVIRKGDSGRKKRTAATGSIFAGLYSWRRDSFPSQPSGWMTVFCCWNSAELFFTEIKEWVYSAPASKLMS